MVTKFKRKLSKYNHLAKPIFLVIVAVILVTIIGKALSPLYQFAKKNQINPKFVSSLIFDDPSGLKSTSERTNILVLGIGGSTHEGPNLTDSILFLSLNFKKKDALMASLPRDIWSPTLKDKINSAYAYGEAKKKGGGLILAKSIVEEIVGFPIHYAWVIDFAGFKNLIDMVGGIDVNVETSFDDLHYPIEGKENDDCNGDKEFLCRYEPLHFDKGFQHMDGTRALKFVRSRFADGDEGNDFARSKRQQKVILALKDKVLHQTDLKDIARNRKIIQAFDDATDTDMNFKEAALLGKLFLSINPQDIRKVIIDSGNEETGRKGFLLNPPAWQFDGQWVLIPRKGETDFREINSYIDCFIKDPACKMTP